MKISSSSSALNLSSNYATTGCLSGVLRRLLCGTLRRIPLIDGEEVPTSLESTAAAEQKIPSAPGIVARLMGLEPVPVYTKPPPDSIGRSRSTNSLESWPGFLSDRKKCGGPQIRTSLSFREVPTYLRRENEDFLILSFSPHDDGEGVFTSNGVKPMMGFGELKEAKAQESSKAKRESRAERRAVEKKAKKRNGRRRRAHINVKDSAEHWEIPEKSIETRKESTFANWGLESEFSSQNSSPDSVLVHPLDKDEQDGKPNQRNSRRKLSSDLADLIGTSPSIHLIRISRDARKRSIDEEKSKSMKPEQACHNFSLMGGSIYRLEEEDVKILNRKSRVIDESVDVGELAAEIGLGVMDSLLLEVVAEFSIARSHNEIV